MHKKIKFAHLADLHLGAFREKRLTDLNFFTFQRAIDKILDEKVDFVLFCGDIFNSAMPPIEIVTKFTAQIKRLKQNKIKLYIIGGSHDYSNSNKSFLDLLDETGILKNVAKTQKTSNNKYKLIITKNDNLKINLAGIIGKKNGYEKTIYENLEPVTLEDNYFNIFLFHTTLDDLKPQSLKNVKSDIDLKLLPQGFNYYAGGHIHKNMQKELNKSKASYSGALFPNNFKELKEEEPTFNLCEFDFDTKQTKIEKITLDTYKKEHIPILVENLNPIEAKNKILEEIEKKDIEDKIILLEIEGTIDGKITQIELNKIIANLYEKGVFHVLKNTYKLKSNLLDNQNIITEDEPQKIENKIIEDTLKDIKDKEEYKLKKELIQKLLGLQLTKLDEEKVAQYEKRIIDEIDKVLK